MLFKAALPPRPGQAVGKILDGVRQPGLHFWLSPARRPSTSHCSEPDLMCKMGIRGPALLPPQVCEEKCSEAQGTCYQLLA